MIGVHMAPNGVLTGSPGRELAGEADGGVGLAPRVQKWTEKIGDPGPGWVPKIAGPGDRPKLETDGMAEEISAGRCGIRG